MAKIARKNKFAPQLTMPGFIAPQLCELVVSPPKGDGWVHEAKLDGYRMQLHVRGVKSRFFSRRGLDWTHRFPDIAAAGEALDDCIIDGEVCAIDTNGLPTFAGLTDALTAKNTSHLVYYVFDMMWGEQSSLLSSPLLARKKIVKRSCAKLTRLDKRRFAFVDHHTGGGDALHQSACEMKLEGIVSKRLDAPYRPGDRSGIWKKAKCRPSQELVVGGWKATGAAFRSLAEGAYVGGKLLHVGTVGTGFSQRNLPELRKALKERETNVSPFDVVNDPKALRDVHWVKPTLVIEAEIASWTSDNLVRQASYKGLREDKNATDVVVEFAHKPPND